MNAKFQTLVEHLYVVDGMLERLPHNQTAIPVPQANHRHLGALFVLAEAQGQLNNSDLIEKRLTILVRDTFYGSHGGITAGLRRAMDTANQWLFQYNATKDDAHKIIAGIAAVVLHEDDLFIAQAGPAAVFTRFSGYVTRYPENSTWLEPVANPLAGPSPALGMNYVIDPYITHLQVTGNDVVTLVDGRLGKNLSKEKAAHILTTHGIKQIGQKLVKGTQLQHGSAMVIQIVGEPATATTAAPAPKRPAATPNRGGRSKGGFNFALPTSMPTAHTQQPAGATTMRHKQFPISLPSLPELPPMPDIPFNEIWQTISSAVIGGVKFLGTGLHTLLRLMLPSEGTDAGFDDTPSAHQASHNALKIVAIALPLLVIAIAVGRYLYQDYHQTQTYLTTVAEASDKYTAAITMPPEQARRLLDEAAILSQQAGAIKPEHPEVDDLSEKISTQQDTINKVKYIYHLPALQVFSENAQLKQVIQVGSQVFVLDETTGAIYLNDLAPLEDSFVSEGTVIAQQAQQVQDVIIGQVLGMVWIPAAGNHTRSSLVIVARNGLFEFDPRLGTVEKSNLYSVDQWQNPVAFGSFYGNFYVLDSGANQIYRYLPTDDGYSIPPDNYFPNGTEINLAGAVDMAIDTNIYVLYQDGRIAKFLSGEPVVEFKLTGLDVPFKNPTAIFTLPDTVDYLYVADAGNQRIVQLTKEGSFVAQYKPKNDEGITFDDLRGLYVNEEKGKIYLLNGITLYAPNLINE